MRHFALALMLTSCASTHGTISTRTAELGAASSLCEHRVPGDACVKCHPTLAAEFKKGGDWCAEHDVPESQCLICHPDLTFDPLPALNATADLAWLSRQGEAVGPLADRAVKGKVTVFDFYADWCEPCRKVDLFLYAAVNQRPELAVRKLNVVSWETPLAAEHMKDVPTLPHLVVLGRDGRQVRVISGFKLDDLEAAIEEASR